MHFISIEKLRKSPISSTLERIKYQALWFIYINLNSDGLEEFIPIMNTSYFLKERRNEMIGNGILPAFCFDNDGTLEQFNGKCIDLVKQYYTFFNRNGYRMGKGAFILAYTRRCITIKTDIPVFTLSGLNISFPHPSLLCRVLVNKNLIEGEEVSFRQDINNQERYDIYINPPINVKILSRRFSPYFNNEGDIVNPNIQTSKSNHKPITFSLLVHGDSYENDFIKSIQSGSLPIIKKGKQNEGFLDELIKSHKNVYFIEGDEHLPLTHDREDRFKECVKLLSLLDKLSVNRIRELIISNQYIPLTPVFSFSYPPIKIEERLVFRYEIPFYAEVYEWDNQIVHRLHNREKIIPIIKKVMKVIDLPITKIDEDNGLIFYNQIPSLSDIIEEEFGDNSIFVNTFSSHINNTLELVSILEKNGIFLSKLSPFHLFKYNDKFIPLVFEERDDNNSKYAEMSICCNFIYYLVSLREIKVEQGSYSPIVSKFYNSMLEKLIPTKSIPSKNRMFYKIKLLSKIRDSRTGAMLAYLESM